MAGWTVFQNDRQNRCWLIVGKTGFAVVAMCKGTQDATQVHDDALLSQFAQDADAVGIVRRWSDLTALLAFAREDEAA